MVKTIHPSHSSNSSALANPTSVSILRSTSSSSQNPDRKQSKVWDYDEDKPGPSQEGQDPSREGQDPAGSEEEHSNTHLPSNLINPELVGSSDSNQIAIQDNSQASIYQLNKCDKKSRPEDIPICCRELRGDDERCLIDPDIVRDVIIGLSDGLTVPFGLTAGLSSLGSSHLVVVGGLAELISGAISMGIGGYLASEAERDHFKYLQKRTRERVMRSCPGEIEREVHQVLGPVGLDESISRTVAAALLRVESEANEDLSSTGPEEETTLRWLLKCFSRQPKFHKRDSELNNRLRWEKDVGISAFLLKFGEGEEEVPESRLYSSALIIGSAYAVGGLVPMAPYFFIESAQIALYWSIAIMLLTLSIFGVFKAYYTGAKIGFLGYLKASSATIIVGGAAAVASWLIVKAIGEP